MIKEIVLNIINLIKYALFSKSFRFIIRYISTKMDTITAIVQEVNAITEKKILHDRLFNFVGSSRILKRNNTKKGIHIILNICRWARADAKWKGLNANINPEINDTYLSLNK